MHSGKKILASKRVKNKKYCQTQHTPLQLCVSNAHLIYCFLVIKLKATTKYVGVRIYGVKSSQ